MNPGDNPRDDSIGNLLASLRERARELDCLYRIEELMVNPDADPATVCRGVVEVLPSGWSRPDLAEVSLTLRGETWRSPDWIESPWRLTAEIRIQEMVLGEITLAYRERLPEADDGPFLKEEARLIRTVADRLALFLHHRLMREHFRELESAQKRLRGRKSVSWRLVLDIVKKTDRNLYMRIAHKMLNQLCWSGIAEAEDLLRKADIPRWGEDEVLDRESNRPHRARPAALPVDLSEDTFRIAAAHLSDEDILFRIEKWMQEDKLGFLVRAVERNLSLPEITDAIRRYTEMSSQETELSHSVRAGVRVSLIRRFLSDQLDYIRIAKEHIGIRDFHELVKTMIYARESLGRLGGKAAGLYLATQILRTEGRTNPELAEVRTPKTWYITSDLHLHFLHYNNLDEVVDQKYKELSQIRFEYPHIVHLCKNSRFPPELVSGLALALDDFQQTPLVVRSSSLLEDRAGAAFSGKYKSLFLANQGTKQERLAALLDAVAEIYASLFGPDPMEYRAQHGLIDFSEEMGILIQEVVGRRVGPYWLPLFAGVAFSRNEFRWSPRIRREDGLLRLVPGLGTRAVDRVGEDFPVMFAPGQPGLRVSVSPDEILRYSPRFLDVINLEKNTFETVELADVLAKHGDAVHNLPLVVSALRDGQLQRLSLAEPLPPADTLVASFEGLMSDKAFARRMQAVLQALEKHLESPVDIEFAHDGDRLFLLQCRVQSSTEDQGPVPIPRHVPPERVIFTANRFVSNGRVPDLTHIVYVDPERYAALPDIERLKAVGLAVGGLNKVLPKRQFILLGPGRWGSRGDIKLGVSVGYSDISNSAMLVEIARKKGNYTPDLSFGTHFFQDLVEGAIRYLPLYPDEPGIRFNEDFLRTAPNALPALLPSFGHLGDTIRVIDVPAAAKGLVLRILLNADLDEAIAFLAPPGTPFVPESGPDAPAEKAVDAHWRWRLQAVEHLARSLDGARLGVAGLYLLGSTKNLTAQSRSDVDLLVHFRGTHRQKALLSEWLAGFSQALSEMNFQLTGYHRPGGLLDVQFVTDEDVASRRGYAAKIGAVTDAARLLPLASSAAE